MSITDVITQVKAAGIILWAENDRLRYNAPVGALTPELRDAIARHRDGLLAVLAPPRAFVTLKDGPTLPVEVVELELDLAGRGIQLYLDDDNQLVVNRDDPRLTDADQARIIRWRHHLGALTAYKTPELVQ